MYFILSRLLCWILTGEWTPPEKRKRKKNNDWDWKDLWR
jgi:hypothetical protein